MVGWLTARCAIWGKFESQIKKFGDTHKYSCKFRILQCWRSMHEHTAAREVLDGKHHRESFRHTDFVSLLEKEEKRKGTEKNSLCACSTYTGHMYPYSSGASLHWLVPSYSRDPCDGHREGARRSLQTRWTRLDHLLGQSAEVSRRDLWKKPCF